MIRLQVTIEAPSLDDVAGGFQTVGDILQTAGYEVPHARLGLGPGFCDVAVVDLDADPEDPTPGDGPQHGDDPVETVDTAAAAGDELGSLMTAIGVPDGPSPEPLADDT